MPDKASPKRGRFEILPAKRLTVIDRYQRIPKQSRVNWLKTNWDEDKVGVLQVAYITDGEYKGRLHVYQGGTRHAVKMATDPDYLFDCYIKDMTAKEAAKRFLAENRDSQKPSAFARFKVGTAAGEAVALAVEAALAEVELVADESRSIYGNGTPGMFSAFAAAERIVKRSYAITADWDLASAHLAWSLKAGRRAYPQHGEQTTASGHDADIIQALSTMAFKNVRIVGDDALEGKVVSAVNTYYAGWNDTLDKLFEDRQLMKPEHWRTAYVALRGNVGGSESRGVQIQKLIAKNFNRGNSGILMRYDA